MDRLNRTIAVLLSILSPLSFASTVSAHHVSMSFSEWELHDTGLSLLYRIPLADALWLMDPDLVIKEETRIRLKRPVDDVVEARLRDFLGFRMKEKLSVAECDFDEATEVEIVGASVLIRMTMSCLPEYIEDFDLVNHFLVDENRLHTSLATLHFPDHLRQCLFRASKHTCSVEIPGPDRAPAGQARIARWWDLVALLLLFSGAALPLRALVTNTALLILGHGLAPLAVLNGFPVPPLEIVMTTIAFLPPCYAIPVYAASGGDMKRAAVWTTAGYVLLACLGCSGLFRTGIITIAGSAIVCASLLLPSLATGTAAETKGSNRIDLRVLSLCFGLLHGFILFRAPFEALPFTGTATPIIGLASFLVLALLSVVFDRLVFRLGGRSFASVLILSAGILVLLLRNSTLPVSSFSIEGARNLLLGFIQRGETGSSVPVTALILSIILGGLHALTPGHGKSIVAAYLVGTKGRVSDAIVLGMIVTFTHTFIIVLLALLALFASQYILPDQLMPWITCSSGILILVLGAWLFQSRLRNALRFGTATSLPDASALHGSEGTVRDHGQEHRLAHNHRHDHGRTVRHSHNGVSHTHVLPSPDVRFWNLAALGVSGGIVPCPDALAVLLIAVSINRIPLGISVILAFSMGLAAVLIAIGIAMVKARPLFDRVSGGGRLTTIWLPLTSAALVTFLGAVVIWKTIPW